MSVLLGEERMKGDKTKEGSEEWINHYLNEEWFDEKYGSGWKDEIPKDIINHYKAQAYYSMLTLIACQNQNNKNIPIENINLFLEELQEGIKEIVDCKINQYLRQE